MSRLFNLENPIWRFIGNLADLFALSFFWYLLCIPVLTAGNATTAMYYVTLKLSSKQEGYTLRSFWKSFRLNFRQAVILGSAALIAGGILFIDIYFCLVSGKTFSYVLFPAAVIICIFYLIFTSLLFPLLARCENTIKGLLKQCLSICLKEFLPLFSTVIMTLGIFAAGIFLFWPLLLLAPGLSAYINSHIYNRIFEKYHLNLL